MEKRRDRVSARTFLEPGRNVRVNLNRLKRRAQRPGTEPLRVADVGQVFVVSQDEDGMWGPQPPLLKGHVDGQKFPVPHVVVPLGVKRLDRKAMDGRVGPPQSVGTGQLRCLYPTHPPPR